jgi:IMP dehydrogenase
MDTVTTSTMAIAIARLGGVGVIHRNLSIEEQAEEVAKVKRSQSGMIVDPVTVNPEMNLQEVEELANHFGSSSFPVVEKATGKLLGLITNRDIRLQSPKKQVKDVMTVRSEVLVGSPKTTSEEALSFFLKNKKEKLPLVDKNDKIVGFYTWKDVARKQEYPLANVDKLERLLVGGAIGVFGDDLLPRADALLNAGVDILVMDAKNGHHLTALKALETLRNKFPKAEIIPPNIVTPAGVLAQIKCGASAVKVGIGIGSICTSTDITGVGMPQFSAVLECAEVANKNNIPLIADGGFRSSADIVKALAAGASSVMSGRLIAGTDETPGETLADDPNLKLYRGMGSSGAQTTRYSTRYLQNRIPEGVEAAVPLRGPVEKVVSSLMTGVRTAMSELNAKKVSDLWKVDFREYSSAGIVESKPHDIILLDEVRKSI